MKKFNVVLRLLFATFCLALFTSQIFLNPAIATTHNHSSFYISMTTYHNRMMDAVPSGFVAFIGNSHLQSMPVNFIVPEAVNLGIGGDTVQGVTDRLKGNSKLVTAKAIVLDVGINNLANGYTPTALQTPTKDMLAVFPASVPLIWLEVPPVDEKKYAYVKNTDIKLYNEFIKKLCSARKNCTYSAFPSVLKDGNGLSPSYHIGDGLHLNGKGYKI